MKDIELKYTFETEYELEDFITTAEQNRLHRIAFDAYREKLRQFAKYGVTEILERIEKSKHEFPDGNEQVALPTEYQVIDTIEVLRDILFEVRTEYNLIDD